MGCNDKNHMKEYPNAINSFGAGDLVYINGVACQDVTFVLNGRVEYEYRYKPGLFKRMWGTKNSEHDPRGTDIRHICMASVLIL